MSTADLPEPGMTSFDYGQRIQWFTADQLRAYGDKRAREAVASGWKLVPVEPTEEMFINGMEADCVGRPSVDDETHVRSIWREMLAVAPTLGNKT